MAGSRPNPGHSARVGGRRTRVELEAVYVVGCEDLLEDGKAMAPNTFIAVVEGDVRRPILVGDSPLRVFAQDRRCHGLIQTRRMMYIGHADRYQGPFLLVMNLLGNDVEQIRF